VNNVIYIGSASSDHALEIDGPEGSLNGAFTLTNGTFVGYNEGYEIDGADTTWNGNFGEYADFRDGAQGNLSNLYFMNFSENSDVEIDDDASSSNYQNGILNFNSTWQFNTSHLNGGNTMVDDIFADKSPSGGALTDLSFSEETTSPSVGADATAFTGWTWGDAIGALDNL
jgi:hypothetical protein